MGPRSTRIRRGASPRTRASPLILEGDLFDPFSVEADHDSLVVGSDSIYAGTHPFGREAKPDEGLPFAGAAIPARPFLGLSDEDVAAIDDILREYLDSA